MTMLNIPFSVRFVNKEGLDELSGRWPALLKRLRTKYPEDQYAYGVPDYDEKCFCPFCPECAAHGVKTKMKLRSHDGRLLKVYDGSGVKDCVILRPYYMCPIHGLMAAHTMEMDGGKIYEKNIVNSSAVYRLIPKTQDLRIEMKSVHLEESSDAGSFAKLINALSMSDTPSQASITRWATDLTRRYCTVLQAHGTQSGIQFLDESGKATLEGKRYVRRALKQGILKKASKDSASTQLG